MGNIAAYAATLQAVVVCACVVVVTGVWCILDYFLRINERLSTRWNNLMVTLGQ